MYIKKLLKVEDIKLGMIVSLKRDDGKFINVEIVPETNYKWDLKKITYRKAVHYCKEECLYKMEDDINELKSFVDDIYSIFDRWIDLGTNDKQEYNLKESVKEKVIEILKWSKQK